MFNVVKQMYNRLGLGDTLNKCQYSLSLRPHSPFLFYSPPPPIKQPDTSNPLPTPPLINESPPSILLYNNDSFGPIHFNLRHLASSCDITNVQNYFSYRYTATGNCLTPSVPTVYIAPFTCCYATSSNKQSQN